MKTSGTCPSVQMIEQIQVLMIMVAPKIKGVFAGQVPIIEDARESARHLAKVVNGLQRGEQFIII